MVEIFHIGEKPRNKKNSFTKLKKEFIKSDFTNELGAREEKKISSHKS